MRHYWLFLLTGLLMGPMVIIGQTYNLTTRLGFANCQFNSLLAEGNKLYCTGVIQDTVSPYKAMNIFACFESSGDLNYFKIFGGDSTINEIGTFENSLIKTADSGFAVCGYTLSSGKSNCLFIKYDSIGNVLSWKQYQLNAPNFFGRNIAQASDGSYYITGTVQYNSGDIDIFLMKLDVFGNQLWVKTYGSTTWLESANSLVITNTNKILIVGARSNGVSNAQFNYSYRKLMLLDSIGGVLLDTIGVDPNVSSAFKTITSKNGGYLFSGSYVEVRSPGYGGEVGYIEKLDSDLHSTWSVKLGVDAPLSMTFLYSLKENMNGEIFASGSMYNNTVPVAERHQNGWLVKLSSSGSLIWSREYRGVTRKGQNIEINKLYDLDLLANGAIVSCGIAQDDNDTFPQKAWLLNLDNNGCLENSFCGYTKVLEMEDEMGLEAFPNPFSDFLSIKVKETTGVPINYGIYDALGQIVYELDWNKVQNGETFTFNFGDWPPGVYFLVIKTTHGGSVRRIVKQM